MWLSSRAYPALLEEDMTWRMIKHSDRTAPETELRSLETDGWGSQQPPPLGFALTTSGENHTPIYTYFLGNICTKTRSVLLMQNDFPGPLPNKPSHAGIHGPDTQSWGTGMLSVCLPASCSCRPHISLWFRKLIIKPSRLLLSCMIACVRAQYVMLSPIYCTFNYLWSYHTADTELK